MEAAGFQIWDDGSLGGFEALRLICFVFRGAVELGRSERLLVFVWGKGFCRPCRGLGFMGETEPSAYALGYRLPALRAWGHGLGAMGRCASVVPASVRSIWLDRTGTASFCVFL